MSFQEDRDVSDVEVDENSRPFFYDITTKDANALDTELEASGFH